MLASRARDAKLSRTLRLGPPEHVEVGLECRMEAATPRAEATPRESDLLGCLAAIGRALHAEFEPRLFLDELSTALCPLVPHDRLDIGYLAEDRRTFSVFAEHGTPGFLPRTERYTTDLERTARVRVADSPLAVVFDGEVLCASHLQTDPRFVRHADKLRAAGLQSAVFVPLMTGNHVIGRSSPSSPTAHTSTRRDADRCGDAGRDRTASGGGS